MATRFDIPNIIPVFPLSGALMLPRATLPLNIFEPRYLAMVDDMLKTDARMIGMVQPFSNDAKKSDLHHIGCAGRITQFSEVEGGRYQIVLSGIARFRLKTEVEGFPAYRQYKVSWDEFIGDIKVPEKDQGIQRDKLIANLKRYFTLHNLKTDWDTLAKARDELLINSMAMLCPFAPEDKQALLEAPTLPDRYETLITLIEYALHDGDTGGKIQ